MLKTKTQVGKGTEFRITAFLILGSLLLFSCTDNANRLKTDDAVRVSEICAADENHHYEFYMPSGAKSCQQLPLLLILDPHGDGAAAIELFKTLAEKYKFALAASNLIRNGYTGYPAAINLLLEDIRNKYAVNEELFLTGFSGGGRMALTYAQYYDLSGVLSVGALTTREQVEASGCIVYAIAGLADFNFIEVAQYLFRPDQSPENLRIEFIADAHQWP